MLVKQIKEKPWTRTLYSSSWWCCCSSVAADSSTAVAPKPLPAARRTRSPTRQPRWGRRMQLDFHGLLVRTGPESLIARTTRQRPDIDAYLCTSSPGDKRPCPCEHHSQPMRVAYWISAASPRDLIRIIQPPEVIQH
jgi:hypothetical protein